MPKLAKPLSPLAVNRLSRPGYHAVGVIPGLNLQITGSGARSWVYRVMVGGKRREIGLGGFPAVPLADARERARRHLVSISDGVDSVRAKAVLKSTLATERAQDLKFMSYAESFIDGRESGWKNKKHAAQWRATLVEYAYPFIGEMIIGDIDTPHVLQILRPIWTTKTETASRVQGRIKVILDAAIAEKRRGGPNPALWAGHLSAILPSPGKVAKVKHQPSLPHDRCPEFLVALGEIKGVAVKALSFLILTAARSEMVRGATWSEFNFKDSVSVIPAVRMKADRDHRVPLTSAMLALLNGQAKGESSDIVFAAPRGGALSDMSLSKVVRDMNGRHGVTWLDPVSGRVAVPHGFRSSFRDWAAERTNFSTKVAEAALAHVLGDETEVAYLRSDLFKKRRSLMQQWGSFLQPAGGKLAARSAR